jgi:hypothetical protein
MAIKQADASIVLPAAAGLRAADLAEIRAMMAHRVDTGRAAGIVVGVIDHKGRQVLSAGRASRNGTQRLTWNSPAAR